MNTIELNNILLEELDFINAPGFQAEVSWPNDRPIPHITSAYCIQGNPVIYFSQFQEIDVQALSELYRSVWSQGKAPLLYVVTRQDILIYNLYADPHNPSNPDDVLPDEQAHQDRLIKHLQALENVEVARQTIADTLSDYRRIYLDTGAFWQTKDGQRIDREKRADKRLLNAIDQLRHKLLGLLNPVLSGESAAEVAYALLGRSIFIRYLEDRKILTSDWVANITKGQASDYLIALDNLTVTYQLFDYLHERFNGDIFPVEQEERKTVNQQHLGLIKAFLRGNDLDSGQLSFWPYDFAHVPIELISGIYDTFLRKETRQQSGAYYTPLALVDFVVEETLPLEKTREGMTILDPACGSGVFLVKAYQRLVKGWKQQHPDQAVSTHLASIMQQSIFGIDIQHNAVRIAAFSLCLAMLDHLKNEDILASMFRFPKLENSNLIHSDFFDKRIDALFTDKQFDRVIGNPPWGRGTLTENAERWMHEHGYAIGERQIVQPFLLRSPMFCTTDGEVVMLAAAKSTIMVNSNPHQEFRRQFFETYQVRAIVNFSALVYELFDGSLSPVVALFYQNQKPVENKKLIYATPKPSSLSQHAGTIILDTTDIKYLEREELLAVPSLWKIVLWGNPRDSALIMMLETMPRLDRLERTEQLRDEILQGFIVGKSKTKETALWLHGMPCIETDKFRPYSVEIHGTVQETHFWRPLTKHQQIYRGPLALIHHSSCQAAYFEAGKVAYRDKITAIPGKPGEEHLLKWIVAYINSSLARYYHFLTSTSWAVERGTIIHDEYKRMPIIIPEKDDPRLQEVLRLFEQIAQLYEKHGTLLSGDVKHSINRIKADIDEMVFDIYDLTPMEIQLVKDMLNYEIKFFEWSKRKSRKIDDAKSNPIRHPETNMLIDYAKAFTEIVGLFLRYQNQTLNAIVYQDGAPLNVIEFELADSEHSREVRCIESSHELRSLLRKLDLRLCEEYASTLYTRRHVRIYDGSRFYLVRPAERRLWTQSQAYADADSFIADMLVRSKKAAMGVTQ